MWIKIRLGYRMLIFDKMAVNIKGKTRWNDEFSLFLLDQSLFLVYCNFEEKNHKDSF